MATNHPIDNLVRALYADGTCSLRDAGDQAGDGNTLVGHFAVFNRWTEIDSMWEGRFLERISPGTFKETFKTRADQIRVLYDHGHDPSIGNKPLGTPDVLEEDSIGARYEVGLFDSSYVQDLKPPLRAGQLGASFRFRVTAEQWVTPKKATDSNPAALDERTISEVELYEFGPVTFPAYQDATAGLRSRTDEFLNYLQDPIFALRMAERVGFKTVEQMLNNTAPHGTASSRPTATNLMRLSVAQTELKRRTK